MAEMSKGRGVSMIPPKDAFGFSAYALPVGSEFTLGKRRWRLASKLADHPDLMTFVEVSAGANTPDRVFNPSEVDDLYRLGVTFWVPMRRGDDE